jgi:serine protease AprX
MLRLLWITLCCLYHVHAYARAIVDAELKTIAHQQIFQEGTPERMSLILFLKSPKQINALLTDLDAIGNITAKPLHFMSAIMVIVPNNTEWIEILAEHPSIAQISLNKMGQEELELSAQSILLTPSPVYPAVDNWWRHGYTGQNGVVGLIDSGVDMNHPGLLNKLIIVRHEDDNGLTNGVRSAHGTGVACIYAGLGSGLFTRERGIAYGVPMILSGLAGEGIGENDDLLLTTTTLDWMLTRAPVRPTVINYSFGNGLISRDRESDWSGLAKIVDYVVNHEKIMWVKSAGNQGFVEAAPKAPYHSSMTSPADNYNGITVANMNPTIIQSGVYTQSANRRLHAIRYTSSRGPTASGRKKPDISAPGNNTRTCAPDPMFYQLNYSDTMDFHDGYRLMGGTSSAAPHVGAAILLLNDAGITHPIAAKALLINSADAWTDSHKPGPDDPNHPYTGGHYPVMGSAWSPTYGWGYLNMQTAFDERHHLIEDELTPDTPLKEYRVSLPVGGKVTLVHERRVGYQSTGEEWRLSHLTLAIFDADTNELLAEDTSAIDTVHQVANCHRQESNKICSNTDRKRDVIIRVRLLNQTLDGSTHEPIALVYG